MKKVKWLLLVPLCTSIASGTIFVDGVSQDSVDKASIIRAEGVVGVIANGTTFDLRPDGVATAMLNAALSSEDYLVYNAITSTVLSVNASGVTFTNVPNYDIYYLRVDTRFSNAQTVGRLLFNNNVETNAWGYQRSISASTLVGGYAYKTNSVMILGNNYASTDLFELPCRLFVEIFNVPNQYHRVTLIGDDIVGTVTPTPLQLFGHGVWQNTNTINVINFTVAVPFGTNSIFELFGRNLQ